MGKFYCNFCLDISGDTVLPEFKLLSVVRLMHSVVVGALQKMTIEAQSKNKVQSLSPLLDENRKVMEMPTVIVELLGVNKQYVLRYDEEMVSQFDFTIPEKYNNTMMIAYVAEGPLTDKHLEDLSGLQERYTGESGDHLFNVVVEDSAVNIKLNGLDEPLTYMFTVFQLIVKNDYIDHLIESVDSEILNPVKKRRE